MADTEWQRLQEALRTARTPEEKAAAAEAMRQYLARKGKGSKPTLCSLTRGGGSSNAVPLDKLPEAMVTDPRVYERVRKVVESYKEK